VANPNPRTDQLEPTKWKPGESGNTGGYSRKRRITDRLIKLLEDENLDKTVAVTLFAAAIGDEKLLKGRKPNAAFMQMLLDRVEGKVKPAPESDEAEEESPATDEHGNPTDP
jgi:hypothetical protein